MENLFSMRPIGVVSKKATGDLFSDSRLRAWMAREAVSELAKLAMVRRVPSNT